MRPRSKKSNKSEKPAKSGLERINTLLLFLILLVNGYVIAVPMLPRINYEIKKNITRPVSVDKNNVQLDRATNHLVIPTIQLDEPIIDNTNPSAINQGIWRRPNTSTPGSGSNTVIVGHRFAYGSATPFYNLDKLSIGDDIFVVYDSKIYHYEVNESKIVPPSAIEIESPTNTELLTIYTCTPIWTAKDRLVYTAKLMEII